MRTEDTPKTTQPEQSYIPETYAAEGFVLSRRRRHLSQAVGIVLMLIGVFWLLSIVRPLPFGFGGMAGRELINSTYSAEHVELHAGNGNVTVRSWDEPGIRVQATYYGGAPGDFDVQVRSQNGVLVIDGGPRTCLFCGGRSLDYELFLPASGNATIETTNGDIDAEGLGGEVRLNSISGSIEASDLAQDTQITTVNGDVELRNAEGTLFVNTTNGDATLDALALDSLFVETVNGDIEVQGNLGQADVKNINGDISLEPTGSEQLNVSTTNGDIRYQGRIAGTQDISITSLSGDTYLDVDAESSFQLEAESVNGDLSSDFELAQERGRMAGSVGSGSAQVRINTTSGDISVDQD